MKDKEEKLHAEYRRQLVKAFGLLEVTPEGSLIERADINSTRYTTIEGVEIQFSGVEFFGKVN